MTIVTLQALSILYYTSPAWLTPAIGKKELTSLESIHFKALRVIVCDHRQRMSRDLISVRTNRLPPKLWCQISAASVLMKVWQTGQHSGLRETFFTNAYTKTRSPDLLFGFDTSIRKTGRQITSNWCGGVLSQINVQ